MNKNEVYFYKGNHIEIIMGKGLIDFPYHTHKSYLLGKITSGKLLMDLNKEQYEMREGMLFIVPSNIRIAMKHQDVFSYTILCFSGIMAEELCKNKPMALVFEDEQNVFERIMTSYQKTKDEKAVLQSVKEAFMVGENMDYFTEKHSKIIEQALSYMDEHIEDKCSVEEIANRLYVKSC